MLVHQQGKFTFGREQVVPTLSQEAAEGHGRRCRAEHRRACDVAVASPRCTTWTRTSSTSSWCRSVSFASSEAVALTWLTSLR